MDKLIKAMTQAISLLIERQQVMKRLLIHIATKSDVYDEVVSRHMGELAECDKHFAEYKESVDKLIKILEGK